MTTLRILSAADVRHALPMRDAIGAMRGAFAALSGGRATVPLRTSLPVNGGVTLLMPAYIDGTPTSTVKIVSVFGDNHHYGLPTIHATVLVLDADTGQPRAILDGSALTAIRTGAASGLATELLAIGDVRTVVCIGAGAQARTQIEAVLCVRPAIEAIHVYSPTAANCARLCADLASQFPDKRFIVAATPAIVAHAQVIIAATTSATPVFDGALIQPGTHINGIGSYLPTMQEIPADVVARAKIVVDSRAACQAEAGDLISAVGSGVWAWDRLHAELGEIVAGDRAGRASDHEITFFKSVGNAVQDAAAAAQLLTIAETQNLGITVEL